MGPYDPPQVIKTSVFAEMPAKYKKSGSQAGKVTTYYARFAMGVDFYLEGPCFDRAGNLFFSDTPHGRIYRMSPKGEIDLFAEYDGEPNGMKIHKDGRIFIADYHHGIMVCDPKTAEVKPFLELRPFESFKGLNDLVFANNGDLYFTDQGQTGLHDATGRVYRFSAGGRLETIVDTLPGPNGLVLSPDNKTLYVGSRSNTVWWQPLRDTHPPFRAGIFSVMTGFGTPDGMSIDVDGSVVCVQTNMGVVWVFNKIGLVIYRIETCTNDKLTNIAYGGPDNKTMFILDGYGKVLTAQMPVAGLPMYSHM